MTHGAISATALGLLCVAAIACNNQPLSSDQNPAQSGDFYSEVASICDFPVPELGQRLTAEAITQTYLTPQCRAALEGPVAQDGTPTNPGAPTGVTGASGPILGVNYGVIKFDVGSFATAPTGMMDKVAEAFQAMIAYPLDVNVSDSTFLGTEPQLSGAIPADFPVIFQQYPSPNQSAFNYVLNSTSIIRWGGSDPDISATYTPAASGQPWVISVYNDFWNLNNSGELIRDPFIRASTLIHEARHGDSFVHEQCVPSVTGVDGSSWECDPFLTGPYGISAVYMKYLLHGSGTCSTPGCTPLLPNMNAVLAGWQMCVVARNRDNNRWPSLEALLGAQAAPFPATVDSDGYCSSVVNYQWIAGLENIPAPPPPGAGGPPASAAFDQKAVVQTFGVFHMPTCDVTEAPSPINAFGGLLQAQ